MDYNFKIERTKNPKAKPHPDTLGVRRISLTTCL